MIISQLSIAPVGKEISISKYIKIAVKILRENNIKYKTNPMSTIIETNDLMSIFKIVEKINEELFTLGIKRVITELKIDYRTDKEATMETKLKSIN
ncbi:MAG: MTH1187 family thiamine-binding protein [Candidatus Thermoplasmatota archaeon]|nr:MTH1187 family thiamine-binding protein [Candidatus Thermoplasmatota archaeon]